MDFAPVLQRLEDICYRQIDSFNKQVQYTFRFLEDSHKLIKLNTTDFERSFRESISSHDDIVPEPEPPKNNKRFVQEDDDFLDPTDLDDVFFEDTKSTKSNKQSLSGSMKDITEYAKSFRERNSCDKKEQKVQDDDVLPDVYEMTDDDETYFDDDDIYERNPIEIHGKMIPYWARGECLENQLLKQEKMDPDKIFSAFEGFINLSEIFGTNNPKWEQRHESIMWGPV